MAAGRADADADAAGAKRKTRTPHSDVGKKSKAMLDHQRVCSRHKMCHLFLKGYGETRYGLPSPANIDPENCSFGED